MKKLATILMLVAVLFVGGTTVDAKTTKNKTKAKTSQTATTQWNGDIPSASVIYNFWSNKTNRSSFINHGYSYLGNEDEGRLVKSEVCSIEWSICGSHSCTLQIYIDDNSKRQWLYNNFKKYISSKKLKNLYVDLQDGGIALTEVYRTF